MCDLVKTSDQDLYPVCSCSCGRSLDFSFEIAIALRERIQERRDRKKHARDFLLAIPVTERVPQKFPICRCPSCHLPLKRDFSLAISVTERVPQKFQGLRVGLSQSCRLSKKFQVSTCPKLSQKQSADLELQITAWEGWDQLCENVSRSRWLSLLRHSRCTPSCCW